MPYFLFIPLTFPLLKNNKIPCRRFEMIRDLKINKKKLK